MSLEAESFVGEYRHYKGGTYRVLGVARHSETMEDMIMYAPLQPHEKTDVRVWVRPLNMFFESVLLSNGDTVPRFSKLEQHG